MVPVAKEMRHLTRTLVARGTVYVGAGAIALAWPEDALVHAMTAVAIAGMLSGLYELTIAYDLRGGARLWWLVLAHGGMMLLFGMLTIGAPRTLIPWPGTTIAAVDLWLLLLSGLAVAVTVYAPSLGMAKPLLSLWAVVNVVLALLASLSPMVTIFSLLYLGAVYAAVVGAGELVAALVILRATRGSRPRHAHAQPAQ